MIIVEWTCPNCEHVFQTDEPYRDISEGSAIAYCPECGYRCGFDPNGEVI